MTKILKAGNFRKTVNYLRRNGLLQAYYAARERIGAAGLENYAYEAPDREELAEQRQQGEAFHTFFSILVPAYETREAYLQAMLDSVIRQSYGNFELILADASKSGRVERIVEGCRDKRIRYLRLKENEGISGNTNQALTHARGDYIALLDHDDLLTEDALFMVASCIETEKRKGIELQMIYSDEDKCDETGEVYYEPHKKGKFNLDLILSNNYICHLLVMKRELMLKTGFRKDYDGAQDYDLVLGAVSHMLEEGESAPAGRAYLDERIAHIPKVLYHWRCHSASTAANPESKRYAYEAGRRAVEDFLNRRQMKGMVLPLRHLGFYRVDYSPSFFANRPEAALLGGRILDAHNKITGGICDASGKPLYVGLYKEFSGYMHRAVLMQEAERVDIRCMQAAKELQDQWTALTGVPYTVLPKNGCFDWHTLPKPCDYEALSRKVCEHARKLGYTIVYDPQLTEKIKK